MTSRDSGRQWSAGGVTAGLACIVLTACVPPAAPDNDNAPAIDFDWSLPRGFPAPVVPDDNPMTAEKAALGRYLFHDTRLSGNGTQACASCHVQSLGFAESRTTSIGSTGELTARNAPGLANVAYYSTYTWSSELLEEIEQQMLIPMFGEAPIELGITGRDDEVLQRFRDDPTYRAMFASAYPGEDDAIDFDHIVNAIASFLRTMIAGNSPWHRAIYQGEADAISDSVRRGAELFFSERLECHHCHGGFHFSQATRHDGTVFDQRAFHNIGLYNVDGFGAYPASDQGLIRFTGDPDDMGKFRAPSLINVAVTGPYFHDGSAATLVDVLAVYEAGGRLIESGPSAGDGRTNSLKSGFIRGFTLTDDERADLIAFLEALTDESFLSAPEFSSPFPSDP